MNYINEFTSYLKAKRMAEKTIKDYTTDVTKMHEIVGKSDDEITYLDLVNWVGTISHLSSATVQRRIVSIRRYFSVLKNLGLIENNPAEALESVKVHNKQKVVLTENEMRSMIDSAKNIRDKAIISLLSHSAIRVSELINLKATDATSDMIVIHGKGDKERLVYIDTETRGYINEYLKVRNNGCDNLFVSNQGTPMKEKAINFTLKNTGKRAGIQNYERITPHLFRASKATALDEARVSMSVIKEVLGHTNIQTTSLYIKTSPSRVKEAMSMAI